MRCKQYWQGVVLSNLEGTYRPKSTFKRANNTKAVQFSPMTSLLLVHLKNKIKNKIVSWLPEQLVDSSFLFD